MKSWSGRVKEEKKKRGKNESRHVLKREHERRINNNTKGLLKESEKFYLFIPEDAILGLGGGNVIAKHKNWIH